MKKCVRVMTLWLFVALPLLGAEPKVDFSGTWSLNPDKSKIGEGRGWRVASKLVITQKENELNIERTSTNRDGEASVTKEILTLDGKECTNTFRDNPRKSVVSWDAAGVQLTIASTMTFERNGNKRDIQSTEIWSLQDSGKSLSIQVTSKTPRGEQKNSLLYQKN